jgi:hypothetical protein
MGLATTTGADQHQPSLWLGGKGFGRFAGPPKLLLTGKPRFSGVNIGKSETSQ